MKIPKAKKLSCGSWFIQLRLNGASIPITKATERECIRAAELLKAEHRSGMQKVTAQADILLCDAYARYVDAKTGVLSPATIAGYKRLMKNSLPDIMQKPLRTLTQEKIQRAVTNMAIAGKSPKSIANAVGLLSAVLKMQYPGFSFHVTLPPRTHKKRIEPQESDISAIAEAVRGKAVELPTLLAMWMGLRMSEILGLTWDCIDGDIMHIRQAKVDEGVKSTKTYSGTRDIRIPPYIKQLLDNKSRDSDFICPVTRGAIYDAFQKYTSRAGIQHYRFHDLRHLNTTVQLLLGIDDKAIIQRNGWSTDAMIRSVYGHTSGERIALAADVIDDYFTGKIANESANEKNDAIEPFIRRNDGVRIPDEAPKKPSPAGRWLFCC